MNNFIFANNQTFKFSPMTTFTIHTDDKEQMNALKAVLKALKIKFEISKEKHFDIPEEHINLVRERINDSKENELLDWDTVKNEFDGI
jgi:hypothetical protein